MRQRRPPGVAPAAAAAALAALVLGTAASAHADDAGAPVPVPAPSWAERYEQAKHELVVGHYVLARVRFEGLARDPAATAEQRAIAEQMAEVCRETVTTHQLARERYAATIRTDEEMGLLYAHSFLYGLGTAAWFVLEADPGSVAAAILPFAGFTVGAVGGVAALDHYRPFARGVPYSISVGLYLGFGEGVWITAFQKQRSIRIREATGDDPSWESRDVATVLWAGATTGAVVGALVGSVRHPTPGRASFTASTTIWSGTLAALGTAAVLPYSDKRRGEQTFAVAGGVYNAGLLTGLLIAPSVNPSVARVRFTDLGGAGGGLLAAGAYALGAGSKTDARTTCAAAAIGGAVGLGVTWVATAELDRGVGTAPPPTNASASSSPLPITVQPIVTPLPTGGLQVGVAGAM